MIMQNLLIGLRILCVTHFSCEMFSRNGEIWLAGPEPSELEECQQDMLSKVGFIWNKTQAIWIVFLEKGE